MSYISKGDLLFSNVNGTKFIAAGPEFVKSVRGIAKQYVPVINQETGMRYDERLRNVVKLNG